MSDAAPSEFMRLLFLGMRNIPIGQVNLASLVGQNMSIIAHVVPASELRLNQLQSEGGACPKCGIPWRKRHFKNRLTEFDIFTPSCSCYPRCPYCGRYLMVEVEEKLDGCVYCGPAICSVWVEKKRHEGREVIKWHEPCGGIAQPYPGGFLCKSCGADNQIIRVQRGKS